MHNVHLQEERQALSQTHHFEEEKRGKFLFCQERTDNNLRWNKSEYGNVKDI
jgi:hypothetical protein